MFGKLIQYNKIRANSYDKGSAADKIGHFLDTDPHARKLFSNLHERNDVKKFIADEFGDAREIRADLLERKLRLHSQKAGDLFTSKDAEVMDDMFHGQHVSDEEINNANE